VSAGLGLPSRKLGKGTSPTGVQGSRKDLTKKNARERYVIDERGKGNHIGGKKGPPKEKEGEEKYCALSEHPAGMTSEQ